MLSDYCLFFGGVLYLLMGRHILFLSSHRRQGKKIEREERERKKKHALFATIVVLHCQLSMKAERARQGRLRRGHRLGGDVHDFIQSMVSVRFCLPRSPCLFLFELALYLIRAFEEEQRCQMCS